MIFGIGIGIVLQQTGFPLLLESPQQGPSIPALVIGALFCNGPVMLQALALRFGGGTAQSGQQPEQPPSVSSSESSAEPSSGGS